MKNELENDLCDLDSSKVCDNCCKCLEQPDELATDEQGYRMIMAEFAGEEGNAAELEQASAIAALFAQEEEEEESYELDLPEVPPELMAEWEAKLAASFREEEEGLPAPQKLHGSRKKR